MFQIEINFTKQIPTTKLSQSFDPEFDDITSILNTICDSMEEHELFILKIQFGEQEMSLKGGYDLSALLMDFDQSYKDFVSGKDFSLEIHSQGVEKKFDFKIMGENVEVTTSSYLVKGQTVDIVSRFVLQSMINTFISSFLLAAKNHTPNLTTHQWFKDWEKSFL